MHPGPTNLPHSQVQRTRRHPGLAPQRSQGGGRLLLVMLSLHTCAGTEVHQPQVNYHARVHLSSEQRKCTSSYTDCDSEHLVIWSI